MKSFFRVALFLGITSTFFSCVDNDYDLSKDVDLTMGLGSENLTLKIGETEKIFLRDMLEIEDSNVDTLKNGRSLYYFIKDGEAQVDVVVPKIPVFSVPEVNIISSTPVIPSDAYGEWITPGTYRQNSITAQAPMEIDIRNIPEEIIRLRRISPLSKIIKMKVQVDQPAGGSFVITEIKNLTVTFPGFLFYTAHDGSTKQEYQVPDIIGNNSSSINLPSLSLAYMQFGEESTYGTRITDGTLFLSENVKIQGDFTLELSDAYLHESPQEVNVKLVVELGDVDIHHISGIVDPLIEPVVDPIGVEESLPGFLQDPAVVLEVSNPTLKFEVKGETLPIPLLFSGDLTNIKAGQITGPVRVPASGYDEIPAGENHTFYFYQGHQPFDPKGIGSSDATHFVPTLSTLIRNVPEYVQVDLSERRVKSDPEKLHTITLGERFETAMDYELLIPFIFDKGLRIVYTDTIIDMNSDLKDYQAHGLTLTAIAVNAIPLDLNLTLVPLGYNKLGIPDQELTDEIEVVPTLIPAAKGLTEADITETEIAIVMNVSNPEAVSRLDRFDIRVDGESIDSSELTSEQYFYLKEMRIKLHGQIIANFN